MADDTTGLRGAGENEEHGRTSLFVRSPVPRDEGVGPPPEDRTDDAGTAAPLPADEAVPGAPPPPTIGVPEPPTEAPADPTVAPEAPADPTVAPEATSPEATSPEEEPAPAPGEAVTARPAGDEVGASAAPVFGRTAPPAPSAGGTRRLPTQRGSASRWRSVAVPTRFMTLAVLGVLVLGLVSVGAILATAQVDRIATDAVDLADARRHNAEAAALLREVELVVRAGAAPGATDEIVRRQAVAVARLDTALSGEAGLADQAGNAAALGDDAVEALAETPEGEAPDDGALDALDDVLAARQGLEEDLAAAEAAARDDLDAVRSAIVVAALVVVALVAIGLPWLARTLGRSVVSPLRDLGRSMRRFGDGDLRVRASEGGDEVGALARSFNLLADGAGHRIRDLSVDAERGAQLRVVGEALELATDEDDVHRIVEHALAILVPGTPAELLVTGEDGSRLRQVAVNPSAPAPNCPVPDASGCVAIRRGQAVTFPSPDTLNACPWLRDRPRGARSATCVPATAMGHLLGVLHSTGPVGDPPGREPVEQMVTIVSQASTRIGALRTLESTRTLASTDTLTGLANRRTLETRLGDLIRTSTPFVLAVADLDHFKSLNDTWGHELGDRALQLFARVLSDNVRGHDLVARYGGEEFVLVYPEMDLRRSMEVIDRIRTALARAVGDARVPPFTASFGVTHSSAGDDPDAIIRVADAGLLLAKDQGRDRVVYSDAEVAATVFDGPRDRGPRPEGAGGPS